MKKDLILRYRGRYWQRKLMLRMKATMMILMLVVSISYGNNSNAQSKVSIKVKNATLIELLEQIENQSNVGFVFDTKELDLEKRYSINQSNIHVIDLLDNILEKDKYLLREVGDNIIIKKLLIAPTSESQNQQKHTVTGKVTDTTGEPLPGVNVYEMIRPQNGVITGIDGNYTINLSSEDAILVFSFIGYEAQEINISGRSTINITLMEETTGLDEVIVVGYGTQKKVNMTGAVDQIQGDALENRPIKSISQGLKGIIPNLNITETSGAPNSNASFNIRGFTGLDEDGDPVKGSPLVLVDGVAMDMNLINPEDVASISVLKDAAASAIYGSRAPYGVILITTKKGQSGKMRVNVSSNISFSQVVGLPESVNSYEFAQAWNDAHKNARKGAYYSDETLEILKDVVDGKIKDASRIDPGAGRWGAYGDYQLGNTNWQDAAYRDWSVNQKHTISFSGGLEDNKLNYYASMGWNENQGIMHESITDKYNRYNTVLKLSSQVTDWLQLSLDNKYSRGIADRPGYGSDYYYTELVGGRTWPTVPFYNPDGNMPYSNPVFRFKEGGNYKDYVDDFWTTAAFDLTPLKGLKIHGAYSWNVYSRDYTEPSLNITAITDWTDEDGKYWYHEWYYAQHPNSIFKRFYKNTYHQVDLYANYDFKIGADHNFTIIAGYNEELKKYHYLQGSKTQLVTEDLPTISTAIGESPSVDDALSHWATRGYFSRLAYNYKEKIMLEFNGRYDASSRFPEDQRWEFFPSFSAGYNIAKENFWPVEQVSMFKIRGSYGKLGNQSAYGLYPYLPTMSINAKTQNVLGGNRVPSVERPGLVSSDITWEKPETIDFGFDLAAFNNRLNVTYDWYQRTVYDQLGTAEQLPEVLGISVPQKNDAVTETRGWELSIGWKDRATLANKTLNWGVRAIVSDFIGYVVEYDNQTGSRGVWTPGERFGDIYGYRIDKRANSSSDFSNGPSHHRLHSDYWYPGDLVYKDLDGDGKVDSGNGSFYNLGDLEVIGNTSPRYSYGFNINADWNGFDLLMNFEGVGKQDLWFNGLYYQGVTGSIWWSTLMKHSLDYYSVDNKDAFFPRPYMSSESGRKLGQMTNI